MRTKLLAIIGLAIFQCVFVTHAVAGTDKILRRASTVEPETLDPQKSSGTPEQNIESDLFEGLTAYDAYAHVIPGVAQRWETSRDGLVWTFYLRPDAKWSDGTPVTARDFVTSFRRLIRPATASPSAEMFEVFATATEIKDGEESDLSKLGVTAIDDLTLRLTLIHPMPLLPELLATAMAVPVNAAAVDKFGDQWARPGNIVSNGPYLLAAWTPQSKLILKRNPEFHDATSVAFEEVDWVVTEDDYTALKNFRAGELDISRVPAGEFDWSKRNMPRELHVGTQYALYYLSINMLREPLSSNAKLRNALSMAIDREVLINKVEPAGEIAAYGLVPNGIAGYEAQVASFKSWSTTQRLATARQLFEESGAGKLGPIKFSIIYTTDRDNKKVLLSIASMWKSCCDIEVTLVNQEWLVWLAHLRERDFQIALDHIAGSYADAYDVLASYHSKAGEMNDASYASPAYDWLLQQASSTTDAGDRGRLLGQAERLLIDDAALIPLNFPVNRMLVSARLQGWQENLLNEHPSRFLSMQAAQ